MGIGVVLIVVGVVLLVNVLAICVCVVAKLGDEDNNAEPRDEWSASR